MRFAIGLAHFSRPMNVAIPGGSSSDLKDTVMYKYCKLFFGGEEFIVGHVV